MYDRRSRYTEGSADVSEAGIRTYGVVNLLKEKGVNDGFRDQYVGRELSVLMVGDQSNPDSRVSRWNDPHTDPS